MRTVANSAETLFSSTSEEWYTPKYILDRVLEVMGEIDLDPCAETKIDPNVPARKHYTKADDGLTCEWRGKVFANPPYGKNMREWATKFVQEYQNGNMTEGILLAHARTDTIWYSYLYGVPVCFIKGRLKFSASKNSAPFPSAIFYLGPNVEEFAQVFGGLGIVYEPLEWAA